MDLCRQGALLSPGGYRPSLPLGIDPHIGEQPGGIFMKVKKSGRPPVEHASVPLLQPCLFAELVQEAVQLIQSSLAGVLHEQVPN